MDFMPRLFHCSVYAQGYVVRNNGDYTDIFAASGQCFGSCLNVAMAPVTCRFHFTCLHVCGMFNTIFTVHGVLFFVSFSCSSHAGDPLLGICVVGSEGYTNTILQSFVKLITSKASIKVSFFRFFLVPLGMLCLLAGVCLVSVLVLCG